jgi:hypothetical protein
VLPGRSHLLQMWANKVSHADGLVVDGFCNDRGGFGITWPLCPVAVEIVGRPTPPRAIGGYRPSPATHPPYRQENTRASDTVTPTAMVLATTRARVPVTAGTDHRNRSQPRR